MINENETFLHIPEMLFVHYPYGIPPELMHDYGLIDESEFVTDFVISDVISF